MKLSDYFKTNFSEFFFPQNVLNAEDNKLNNLFFYLSMFTSTIATYVLSVQDVSWITTFKKVLMVLVPVLLGLRIMFLRKLNVWYLIFVMIMGAYLFMTRRVEVLGEFILLSWCMFSCLFGPVKKISSKTIFILGLILCGIVGVHFYFFEMYGNRESIGGLDPNYSSFLIYLLIPFALYSRSITLHLLLNFLGLMTQSRAFLAAMVVYYSTYLFMKYSKEIVAPFKKYCSVAGALFLFLLAFSYYGYSLGASSYDTQINGLRRLLHIFNNPSDYERWRANIFFFELCIRNFKFAFLGMEPLLYLKSIDFLLPHNIILLELATHGLVVGSLFLMFFYGFIKRIFHLLFLPFFMGILVYWLLLGIEIGAIYSIFLINLMILLNNGHKEEKRV